MNSVPEPQRLTVSGNRRQNTDRENWATVTVCTMGYIKFILFNSERIETISYQLFIKDTYGSL